MECMQIYVVITPYFRKNNFDLGPVHYQLRFVAPLHLCRTVRNSMHYALVHNATTGKLRVFHDPKSQCYTSELIRDWSTIRTGIDKILLS